MEWQIFIFLRPCRLLPLHVAILSNVELLHLREDWMTLMLQVLALLCGAHHQERSGQGEGLDGRKFTSHISLIRIELMVEGI